MPAPAKSHTGQLQDLKDKNAALQTRLDNLSNVNDDLREANAEIATLKGLLEQAKQNALANNGKARIADLQKELEEVRAQLKSVSGQYHEIKGLYDSRIGGVAAIESRAAEMQSLLRHTTEERDTLAGHVRSVRQAASEQVANVNNQMTQMQEQLRAARNQAAQYESIVREVQAVIRQNPDVLAAVRQKVGLG